MSLSDEYWTQVETQREEVGSYMPAPGRHLLQVWLDKHIETQAQGKQFEVLEVPYDFDTFKEIVSADPDRMLHAEALMTTPGEIGERIIFGFRPEAFRCSEVRRVTIPRWRFTGEARSW